MKKIVIFFLVVISFQTYSQSKFKEVFEDLRVVDIAKIENGSVQFLVDTKDLIETVNHNFSNETNYFTDIELKNEKVEGREVYYLYLSSSLLNRNLATFLDIENNILKLRTEGGLAIRFTYCEGIDLCFPRVFIDPETDKVFFGCREFIGCVDEETAKKEPCLNANSAIFYDE